jgi:nitric oxide synthase-interacting protein
MNNYQISRKKVIDDTESSEKLEQLRKVSPWIPQFTPQAKETEIKEPPRRPPSPCSGRPLRSKDLIPLQLIRESGSENTSGVVRYLCPVTRKTITTQKVVLIKTTGAMMLEQSAKDLAYPSMTCPISGRPFKMEDVLEFSSAASGFAASGKVEAKVHRPTIN